MRRAAEQGIVNITPTEADATSLPYEEGTFDAAFLITVLGEIPDPRAVLGELRRVLKSAGRAVVGEIFIDPDFPRLAWLVRCARDAGLILDRRTGTPAAYFARCRAEPNVA